MKSGTHSILSAFFSLHPNTMAGGKWVRVLLTAALLGMLFPLQPETPCSKASAAPAEMAQPELLDYPLAGQEMPVGLMCESEAQRLQLCDLLPAKASSCLTQAKAISPVERSKIPSPQKASLHIPANKAYDAVFKSEFLGRLSSSQLYSSYTGTPGPARAPPFYIA